MVWGWGRERDGLPSVRSAVVWGAGEGWVLPRGRRCSSEGRGGRRGSGVRRREGCGLGLGSLAWGPRLG